MPDFYIKEGDNFVLYSGAKLVPESDLLAAKGGLESQVSNLKSQLTDAQKAADENLQRATRAESAAEAVRPELESLRAKATQVDTLTSQLQAATEGRTQMETRLLGVRRQELVQKYKMDEARTKELDNLSMDALESLDQTLSKFGNGVGNNPNPNPGPNQPHTSQFDTGGGGGGQQTPLRGRDLIKEGLKSG